MLAPDTPAEPALLQALASDPAAARDHSPLTGRTCLLVDAGGDAPATPSVRAWLRGLPCPSIAIGSRDAALAAACDLQVASLREAEPVLRGIRQSPLAAATLVQLLRVTETMPLEDALQVESLAYATLQSGPEYRQWLAAHRAPSPVAVEDPGPAVEIERDGATLTLHLNRPSNRNAMSMEIRDALVEALQLALADASIARLVIAGRGRCFSTGGDLSEFGSTPDPASGHLIRGLTLPGRLLAQCAARAQALVHGACIGSGIEFPAFAGRVVAAADAHFQLPELKFGLIPGAGGCISIPRRIGRQRTAWLVLTGKRISAAQALEWGLVDQVTDQGRPAGQVVGVR